MPPQTERRRAARVRPPASFRVRIPGLLDAAEVRDVSMNGVCCSTPRPLPLLSQFQLVLLLPVDGRPREVVCTGAVVRCVRDARASGSDASRQTWESAIYFTAVEEADRPALQEYVRSLQRAGQVA